MEEKMAVHCFDIGNSFAHFGIVENAAVISSRDMATRHFVMADEEALAVVREAAASGLPVSFSSVVPAATKGIGKLFGKAGIAGRVFNLNYDTLRGLEIVYPFPREIGQDRLANAVAAQELFGLPCVVVSLGTATVFDVLSTRGYEGGSIAPGLAMMTDYLHEKTAQLPKIDRFCLATDGAIGRSTVEAMKIGARLGFAGMARAILDATLADMAKQGMLEVPVVVTGGNTAVLPENWRDGAKFVPDLAMSGLEIAFRRAG
jgi:type III pantothenate kinase